MPTSQSRPAPRKAAPRNPVGAPEVGQESHIQHESLVLLVLTQLGTTHVSSERGLRQAPCSALCVLTFLLTGKLGRGRLQALQDTLDESGAKRTKASEDAWPKRWCLSL